MARIMIYLLEDKPNDKPSQVVLFYCNPGKQEPDLELRGGGHGTEDPKGLDDSAHSWCKPPRGSSLE